MARRSWSRRKAFLREVSDCMAGCCEICSSQTQIGRLGNGPGIVLDLMSKKIHSLHDVSVCTISLSSVEVSCEKSSWLWHCPGWLPSSNLFFLSLLLQEKNTDCFILLTEQSDVLLSLF